MDLHVHNTTLTCTRREFIEYLEKIIIPDLKAGDVIGHNDEKGTYWYLEGWI